MTSRFFDFGAQQEVAEKDVAKPRLGMFIALGVLWVCALLVFWVFDALPFQDLPAHAGLIALRQRFATSTFDQRFFVLASHVGPYTLFRVLGEVSASILGPLRAVRVLATLPVLTLPFALLFARREFTGKWDPIAGFLGVILSFGFMTVLGFASYLLGLSLLVFTLPFWFRGLERPWADHGKTEVRIMGLSVLLFVAHGHAFILFLAIAGVSMLLTRPRIQTALLLVPAVALAGAVFLFERSHVVPPGAAPFSSHMGTTFQGLSDKLSLLITPTLMTRTGVDFSVGLVVWVFTLAIVARLMLHREKLSLRARSLLVVSGVLFAAFLVLPHNIRWFGFVDGRLVPLFIILPFLAASDLPSPRLAHALAPAMTALIVGGVWVASVRFQREAEGFVEVLGKIPANSRILNLPIDPNSDAFTGHPFVHYDKLVLLDRPAVPSDVWFHQGTALYPTAANPALTLPDSYVESNLSEIRWQSYDLTNWDYILVRSRNPDLLGTIPTSIELVQQRGGWWLYRTQHLL